jgi:hypothetical protein
MDNPDLHFVISAPRSGSTWLTTALNYHPEIFATEHRLFGRFCEVWKNNDGTTAPRITFDSYARAFAMHYFYGFMDLNHGEFVEQFQKEFARFVVDFAQRRTGKRIIVDKITPYPGTADFVVRQIRRLFPDSKIIQLVRDGRDVLTSGTFDWLLKDAEGTARYNFFVGPTPKAKLERFFDDEVIKKWADNWRETITAFDDPGETLQIRYENMKSAFPQVLIEVFATLGVNADREIAARCHQQTTFEKMTGRAAGSHDPTAKARKGIVGDWHNYFTSRDGELFEGLAGRQLRQLGYEMDEHWYKQLPVSLDMTAND